MLRGGHVWLDRALPTDYAANVRVLLVALATCACLPTARAEIAWTQGANSVHQRLPPPSGFVRLEVVPKSFGDYLHRLPLLAGHPDVLLFDGRKKANQRAHAAVLDMDVGTQDLQQCADFVIRLRAEYLHASKQDSAICFRFTSGHKAAWEAFRDGGRPTIKGSQVTWAHTAAVDSTETNFRRYLDLVFTFAGTLSLAAELTPVVDPNTLLAGDVFIHPGAPGHAVIVLDVAQDAKGQRAFLLGQSFMPAQQPHVLKHPDASSAWYVVDTRKPLNTPEWRFSWNELKRFSEQGCP